MEKRRLKMSNKFARQTGIVCAICSKWIEYMPTHLRYSHGGMSLDTYKSLYPETYSGVIFQTALSQNKSRQILSDNKR